MAPMRQVLRCEAQRVTGPDGRAADDRQADALLLL
jgi:hypothetical protein